MASLLLLLPKDIERYNVKISEVEDMTLTSERPIYQLKLKSGYILYIQENDGKDGIDIQFYIPDGWMNTLNKTEDDNEVCSLCGSSLHHMNEKGGVVPNMPANASRKT